MTDEHDYFGTPAVFKQTLDMLYIYVADVNGDEWALSVNEFPVEPLYTLTINGQDMIDFDDWPNAWTKSPLIFKPVDDPNINADYVAEVGSNKRYIKIRRNTGTTMYRTFINTDSYFNSFEQGFDMHKLPPEWVLSDE